MNENGYGFKYYTQADLSGKMSLSERLDALGGGVNNKPDSAVFDKYNEELLNIIPSSCYSKDNNSITLTLTKADLEEAVASFAALVEANGDLSAFMSESRQGGTSYLDSLNSGISKMDSSALFVFTLSYKDNMPAQINVKYSDKDIDSLEFTFAYEQMSIQTRTITFDMFIEAGISVPVHVGV